MYVLMYSCTVYDKHCTRDATLAAPGTSQLDTCYTFCSGADVQYMYTCRCRRMYLWSCDRKICVFENNCFATIACYRSRCSPIPTSYLTV